MIKIYYILPILLLSISACSPVPRSFQYGDLETEEALSCVESCKKDAESCLKDTQLEYESCLKESFFPKKRKSTKEEDKEPLDLDDRTCEPPDSYGCRMLYNDCYDDCGGDVEPIY